MRDLSLSRLGLRCAAALLVVCTAAGAFAQRTPSAEEIAAAKARAVKVICAGVEAQRAANASIVPDKTMIATELKLEMRLHVERLSTVLGSYRKYPEDKDFERFAAVGQRLIRHYVYRLHKKENVNDAEQAEQISQLLTETVKQMAGAMPVRLSERTAPTPPPPAPDEKALIAPVASKAKSQPDSDD